jgi:hypothetical protein
MAHTKKHGGPVPPGNKPHTGPEPATSPPTETPQGAPEKAPQEQDVKRRLGDYSQTAEHSFKQPGGKNDANH